MSVVKRFFEQTKGVIYKAVGYVVELTPYAVVVLGATSTAATTSKADALLALLSILVLGFVLNIIQAFVVNGLLLKFVAHVPPLTFFKAVLPAQTTAFATQSSVATLPLSIRQLGTVGVGATWRTSPPRSGRPSACRDALVCGRCCRPCSPSTRSDWGIRR